MIAVFLLLFVILGYFVFPGHTYLQADTQIYIPMLERAWDPSVLGKDIVAVKPHLAYTIYDEVALAMRWVFGMRFETALAIQQFIFRFLGVLGIYLIASCTKLSKWAALFVTGVFCLGVMAYGPSVLLWEYEPIPRGFALCLIYLAVGLACHEEMTLSGAAGALAFLYHPPTAIPFWIVYALLALVPNEPRTMAARSRGLIPLMVSIGLLVLLAKVQRGGSEAQSFFWRIDDDLAQLQQMRASYNWVSMWFGQNALQYIGLTALAIGGLYRLWKEVTEEFLFFTFGFVLLGVLSIPGSLILLEWLKWGLVPQLQPMRALLLLEASAILIAAMAACHAAKEGQALEAFGWALPVLMLPAQFRFNNLLSFDSLAQSWQRWAFVAVLAALAAILLRLRPEVAAAVPLAAMLLLPRVGVKNYLALHTPELDQLSAWARSSTPKEAVFHFPDAGRDLAVGVFRAESLRAVYVDWKGGGQANYLRELGMEWKQRWDATLKNPYRAEPLEVYSRMGADFVVVKQQHRLEGLQPEFENRTYLAYKIRTITTEDTKEAQRGTKIRSEVGHGPTPSPAMPPFAHATGPTLSSIPEYLREKQELPQSTLRRH